MRRVFLVVEGQTERRFADEVLAPHLQQYGLWLSTVIVATRRDAAGGKHRGGGKWKQWSRDLSQLLRVQDSPEVRVTTMLDLYGLPGDFPGLAAARALKDTDQRALALEQAMGEALGDPRLIPNIVRYEFETLVLAALDALETILENATDWRGLGTLRKEIGSTVPEDINDGPNSAPSKRLIKHMPGYRKTLHGPAALASAGLPALRARCARFDRWVSKLEALGEVQP
jgi:hypothetical protein